MRGQQGLPTRLGQYRRKRCWAWKCDFTPLQQSSVPSPNSHEKEPEVTLWRAGSKGLWGAWGTRPGLTRKRWAALKGCGLRCALSCGVQSPTWQSCIPLHLAGIGAGGLGFSPQSTGPRGCAWPDLSSPPGCRGLDWPPPVTALGPPHIREASVVQCSRPCPVHNGSSLGTGHLAMAQQTPGMRTVDPGAGHTHHALCHRAESARGLPGASPILGWALALK